MNKLPSSNEAEEAVLGAIFLDDSVIEKVLPVISEEDFYNIKNKWVFSAMKEAYKSGGKIDPVIICDILEKRGALAKIGGSYFITGLFDVCISPANIQRHAQIIQNASGLRKIIDISHKISESAYGQKMSAQEAAHELERQIREIRTQESVYSFDSILEEAIENIYNPNLIRTGLGPIDNLTGGMTRGEITTVAGRPGHGKSTTAINIISNLIGAGKKVLLFNREMMNKQAVQKIIVLEAEGHLSYRNLRHGNILSIYKEVINRVKEEVSKKYQNLIMYDNVRTLDETINIICETKPDVVVDDYLQLIKVKGENDKRLTVVRIMEEYKWLGKSNNAAILLLSQLNRKIDDRDDKRPRLADLAESGSIESDSECVIFVYYDWAYHSERSAVGQDVLLYLIQKNRFGTPGRVFMKFLGDECKVREFNAKEYDVAERRGSAL